MDFVLLTDIEPENIRALQFKINELITEIERLQVAVGNLEEQFHNAQVRIRELEWKI